MTRRSSYREGGVPARSWAEFEEAEMRCTKSQSLQMPTAISSWIAGYGNLGRWDSKGLFRAILGAWFHPRHLECARLSGPPALKR